MQRLSLLLAVTLTALCLLSAGATNSAARRTADMTADMKEGTAELQSAGPLAFGPEGILFVADTKAAAILAVATGDVKAAAAAKPLKIEGLNQKIAALLGTSADQILIEDMAINPVSHNAYLSVSRGRGPAATPVVVRATTAGKLEIVALDKVKFSRAALPDAPADQMTGQGNRQSNPRRESITDLAFLDGRVFIAGLANEEFASTLRAIPFPFKDVTAGTNVEIYHGAHGRFETRAPVRTFAAFKVGKEDHLLAAYTCTPLVQFPVNALKPGGKLMGKTIAELGNRNRPLDMIVYEAAGKHYLLMANSSRGVMKITTDKLESAESITAPVPDGGAKGLIFETVAGWTGVEQLDRYDAKHASIVRRAADGAMSLETLPLP
jgi:hypothetical protein